MSEHLIASYDVAPSGVTDIGGSKTLKSVASNFLGEATKITSCKFKVQKSGAPTGSVYAKLYAITGTPGSTGKPTGSALATSDAVDVSTLTGAFQIFTFSGAEQYTMSAATYYEIAVEYTGGDGGSFVQVAYKAAVPGTNGAEQATADSSWAAKNNLTYLYYVYGLDVPGTVTTQACSDVTNNSATLNGTITSTGGEATAVTRRGFCYKVGTTGDPTTSDSVIYDDGAFGVGAYTESLTGLTYNTDYRIRAYIINDAGTSYGDTVQLVLDPTTLTTLTTAYLNIQAFDLTEVEINTSYVRLKEIRIK